MIRVCGHVIMWWSRKWISSLSRLRITTKYFSLKQMGWTYGSRTRSNWIRSLTEVAAVHVVRRTNGTNRVRGSRSQVANRRRWRTLMSWDDRTQLPRSYNRRRAVYLYNTGRKLCTHCKIAFEYISVLLGVATWTSGAVPLWRTVSPDE